jgi:FkbM family methyltransferase
MSEIERIKGQRAGAALETETLRRLLATDLVPNRSVAIDGGAHVGGWSTIMAEHFGKVIAFEPSEAIENLIFNCKELRNVEIIHGALMNERGRVDVIEPGRSTLTARQVRRAKKGPVRCYAIDELALTDLGLLKLDIEGSELLALQGAVETIRRFRPFILCEMAGMGKARGITDTMVQRFILSLGYERTFLDNVDYGFSPL